jgi:hypothetical protein
VVPSNPTSTTSQYFLINRASEVPPYVLTSGAFPVIFSIDSFAIDIKSDELGSLTHRAAQWHQVTYVNLVNSERVFTPDAGQSPWDNGKNNISKW